MRNLVLAIVFMTACASAEPGAQTNSPGQTAPSYDDARSQASEAEIRDARRAYRSACEQHQSTFYCECMTGGMAQMLSPADLAVATAAFAGGNGSASPAARTRVAEAQTGAERACTQFRRS